MPKIIITKAANTGSVPVNVNGKRSELPQNKEITVSDAVLATLEGAMDIEIKVIERVDFSILDGSIPEIAERIAALGPEQAKLLLEAEEQGKTRKGVVEPLTAIIEGA